MKLANMKHLGLVFVVLLALGALTISLVSAQGLEDIPREDTVIFDIDGGSATIASPTVWNIFGPGQGPNVGAGYHQAVNEPLFILNY
jgi:hypothetical protein